MLNGEWCGGCFCSQVLFRANLCFMVLVLVLWGQPFFFRPCVMNSSWGGSTKIVQLTCRHFFLNSYHGNLYFIYFILDFNTFVFVFMFFCKFGQFGRLHIKFCMYFFLY